MHGRWLPRWPWIVAVATVLGVFSGIQAYRLESLARATPAEWWRLILLNLVYWYIPALAAPSIFRLSQRFRFERGRIARALGVHAAGFLALSVLHVLGMQLARLALFGYPASASWSWWVRLQSQYLMNLDWAMMTYFAIVGLSHAILYYGDAQERTVRTAQLEAQLAEAQLRTLQAELHPHFLFNTLHAISALVHKDPEAADRMISRLSDLLRLTLDRTGVQMVPLEEEIEFLQKYLEIEQIRFRDRLDVRVGVAPETLGATVPRLILQPLVENAIRHGIGPQLGAGVVEITAAADGRTLRLQVRDSGVGLTVGALAALEKGIGLSNTRARLQCLYGEDYRLEFTNRGGGLTVRIVIPLRREPPAAAPHSGQQSSAVA
jgi:signal transduction histidine kinase